MRTCKGVWSSELDTDRMAEVGMEAELRSDSGRHEGRREFQIAREIDDRWQPGVEDFRSSGRDERRDERDRDRNRDRDRDRDRRHGRDHRRDNSRVEMEVVGDREDRWNPRADDEDLRSGKDRREMEDGRNGRGGRDRDRDRDRNRDRDRERDGRERKDGRDRRDAAGEEGRGGEVKMEAAPVAEKAPGRSGGVYIPPFKLAQMMRDVDDKSSPQYQRMTWDALRKSINGLVNKVRVSANWGFKTLHL